MRDVSTLDIGNTCQGPESAPCEGSNGRAVVVSQEEGGQRQARAGSCGDGRSRGGGQMLF